MGNTQDEGGSKKQLNSKTTDIISDSTQLNFFQEASNALNSQRMKRAYQVLQAKGFIITNILGKGGFGVVLEGIDRNSEKVAIKLINIQQQETLKLCKKEVENLKRSNGTRVIKHYDHFQDEECKIYFLITEFCSGGNLETYLEKNPKLSEEKIIQITYEILLGVKELHEKNIIHSDIKPQNVLFTENGSIKLCDLGFAVLKLNSDQSRVLAEGLTFGFCAPEQFNHQVGFASDVFATGLILLCMCYPTKRSEELKFLQSNKNDSQFPRLVDIGLKMIVFETKERPKIHEVLSILKPMISQDRNNDEEFNQNKDFLEQMDQFIEQEFVNFDKEIDKIFGQS